MGRRKSKKEGFGLVVKVIIKLNYSLYNGRIPSNPSHESSSLSVVDPACACTLYRSL